ncbi:MAG: hypothetical protein K2G30_05810, partial [Muribaculaceae bacterium]|nr:hypothetical protein [Muribaculaceae bacterium]
GYDIAGDGKASETSMRSAIYMALDVLRNRRSHAEATANPLKPQTAEKPSRGGADKQRSDRKAKGGKEKDAPQAAAHSGQPEAAPEAAPAVSAQPETPSAPAAPVEEAPRD